MAMMAITTSSSMSVNALFIHPRTVQESCGMT
jgi:hypothetical protein